MILPAPLVRRSAVQIVVVARRPDVSLVAVWRIRPGPATVTIVVTARPDACGLATRSVLVVAAGAVAGAAGTIGADGAEVPEVPVPFAATAVNVYVVPFASPATVQVPDPPSMRQERPPGAAVTVMSVGAFEGYATAVVTVAEPSPPVAVGVAGVQGGASAVVIESSDEVQPVVAVRYRTRSDDAVPENAPAATVGALPKKSTVVRFDASRNVLNPSEVTELGQAKVTERSPLASQNASGPIVDTEEGIVIVSRLATLAKA